MTTVPEAAGGRPDVAEALRELKTLRSNDPCAAIAVTTVKATIHTLDTRWLPPEPPEDDTGSS